MSKRVVLTFDDACRTQLKNAIPLLKRFGFGATFYICRFNDEWRAAHEPVLMTPGEIREIHDAGFEIGNHSWNHPDLRSCTPDVIRKEIGSINEYLASAGIPAPETFAYPGGPFAANAVEILREMGFTTARTTEHAAWNIKDCDPMRVPAVPVQGMDKALFPDALSLAGEDDPVVMVFHGTPDEVHPWVDSPLDVFTQYMQQLADGGYKVMSMSEAFRSR